MKLYTDHLDTPLGRILVVVDEHGALVRVHLPGDDPGDAEPSADLFGETVAHDPERCRQAVAQLDEYFRGERREFDLPLAMHGSDFQKRVWAELCRIPYGTTISYRELAERLGTPAASRAVGRANATNPIAIVVPCHRVIGADGTLTGYAGGLGTKQKLLIHEGVLPPMLF